MTVEREGVAVDSLGRPIGEPVTPAGTGRDPAYRGYVNAEHSVGEARIEMPEATNLLRDRIHWGPVWAGFFAAMSTIVLLTLLGVAVGLTRVDVGTAVNQGALSEGAGMASGIWAAVVGIIALGFGGFVAARLAAIFDRTWGGWNGGMVWAVTVPIVLGLAALGAGGLLGSLGNFAAAQGAPIPGVNSPAPNVSAADAARAAALTRNGALWTFFGLLLGAAAAIGGGTLGTRRSVAAEDLTGRVYRD